MRNLRFVHHNVTDLLPLLREYKEESELATRRMACKELTPGNMVRTKIPTQDQRAQANHKKAVWHRREEKRGGGREEEAIHHK